MSKSEFLKEARALNSVQTRSSQTGKIRSAKILDTSALVPDMATMTTVEKNVFANHVRQSLNKERRKSAARAGSYDVSRHITLYLTDKALQSVKN